MLDVVLASRATGYYGVFFCAGSVTSPILGSFVYEKLFKKNWYHTCEVFALGAAIYSVIYTVFNVLPDVHKEGKQLEEMTKLMMNEPKTRDRLTVMLDLRPSDNNNQNI